MSLFGSLFSGVSGLNAQSRSMGMISDNVANVNTTAYKGAFAQFSTLVTKSPTSTSYSPGGVRALTAVEINRQGLVQASESPTDAAITGGGFFVVNTEADTSGEQLYTRAGSFSTDFLGNLVTPSGQYLQGWALDADENIIDINAVETVNVSIVNGLATATTNVELGANLNADEPVYAGVPAYDRNVPAQTMASGNVEPDFSRNVRVFDSLGRPQNLTIGFLKTDDVTRQWAVEVYPADPTQIDAASHPEQWLASFDIRFNNDGTYEGAFQSGAPGTPVVPTVPITWNPVTGAAPSTITVDLGTASDVDGLTQFSSPTSVAFVVQNGAEVGELNGVSINDDGYVVASFTNGEQRRLYRLPVATFANPAALDARTGNVYAQADASGEFNLRFAGSGGAGRITTNSLEAANVDLADEFTKMIVTQRAYSANARVITTTSEMLDELIQIRR